MKNEKSKKTVGTYLKRDWQKHLMLLPTVVILTVFCYVPMVGIVMAFQNYLPSKGYFGSPWAGLYWFKYLFGMNNFTHVIWNTLFISLLKIFTGLAASLIFALLLNELRSNKLRSTIQSFVLFPFFVSWVVLANIVMDIFANEGIINQVISSLTGKSVPFLTEGGYFISMLVLSNIWKEVGYNAIIIVAALMAIDPALYEAATMDGASRSQKLRYITLPGVAPTVAMLLILALGGVLNGGFDQIYNLYNNTVMSSADIIDTYVYRMGVNGGLYSLGTAVGLFKSVVGAVLLVLSYKAADKFAGYRIF